MIALRQLLAPEPRVLTPDRTALVAVGVLAAAATPPMIASSSEVMREIGHSLTGALWVVVVTVGLSVLLARHALSARSVVYARAWLLCGGFLAGSLDATTSYAGVVLLRGEPFAFKAAVEVLLGSVALGGTLGCLFGVGYGPVVAAAVRARLNPTVDGGDRVLFAAGVSLLAVWGLRELLAPLAGPPVCALTGLAGAVAATIAAARLVVRVRFLRRARDGEVPGFHVVPSAGREDEAGLVPLVRTDLPTTGVLAATGISAPYRGERGVLKVALAPLPDEAFRRPVLGMLGGVVGEIGRTLTALVLGVMGVWVAGMIAVFLMVLVSSVGATVSPP